MQLRAGKYGDDKIFITYAETSYSGNGGYGSIYKGTIPRVYVVKVPDMTTIISDEKYDKLLMNTNEDLRTFRDGVLIWGGANKDGKLVIHKIGTPLLDDSYDDITETITKDDVANKIKDATLDEKKKLSGGAIAGIVIGSILGLVILTIVVYYLLRHFKVINKNSSEGFNNPLKKLLPKKFY